MKSKSLLIKIIIVSLVILVIGANLIRVNIIKTVMSQGENAYDQGEYDLAISKCTHANKLIFWNKENKATNLLWRGRSYYEKEEYDQALADFNEAIKLQKDYYPYYTWRARTHKEMRNYKLAIADFSKSIELDGGNNWEKYLERANIFFLNSDYYLEIADYEQAVIILDKIINSNDVSDDRIEELKDKRNNVIERIKRTERLIEWKKKNPEGSVNKWMIFDFLGIDI